MKKISLKLSLIFLVAFSLTFFTSCEQNEINEQHNGQASVNENLKNLIRAVANDDSNDTDITDLNWNDLNCDGIVTFSFEGDDTVYTATVGVDIQPIIDQANLAAGTNYTIDDVVINSVQITDANGTTVTLTDDDDIIDYFDNCSVDGNSNDDGMIDCLDIQYPITVHVYDQASNGTNTVTIANDDQLFDLINTLVSDQMIEFDYPVTLINENNTTVVVNNDDELMNALDAAFDLCGEGDLDDWNNDSGSSDSNSGDGNNDGSNDSLSDVCWDDIMCNDVMVSFTVNGSNAQHEALAGSDIQISIIDLINAQTGANNDLCDIQIQAITYTNPNGVAVVLTDEAQIVDYLDDCSL